VESERPAASSAGPPAIEVAGLTWRYGPLLALDDVSFSVRQGEIFAYLGPNGAGKTTTINTFCGLLPVGPGVVRIGGRDVAREPVAVKQHIGVVTDASNLYPELTCRRNLDYFGELYGLHRPERRERVEELIETFGLAEKADARFRSLSRGQKRRLTIAAALIHRPGVLLLDEPTTGLDVPSARSLRELIRGINRSGATVFLTTHNLVEAEELADRILILVKGRVVTRGTANEIRRRVASAQTISVTFSGPVAEAELRAGCPAVQAASQAEGHWRLEVADRHAALAQLLALAERRGVVIEELLAGAPSLEDAFVSILGEHGPVEERER
jgi:ABC-2 type transport system ATP-binding protein